MRVHVSMPSAAATVPFAASPWLLLFRGSVAIGFGTLALLSSSQTQATLVHLLGVYILIDGILAICAAIADDLAHSRRWLVFAEWAAIAAGLFTFQWPGVSALSLLFFMAAWAILVGLTHVIAAVRFGLPLGERLPLMLNGIIALLFGLVAAAEPGGAASLLARFIGLYAVAFGVMSAGLALRLWRVAPQEAAD